jgi:hypothetical protein
MIMELRKNAELIIGTLADLRELVALMRVPVPTSIPDTAEKLKALHFSGVLGIVFLTILICATKARVQTVDVSAFLLLSIAYLTFDSWLAAAVLRAWQFSRIDSNAIADGLTLAIASVFVGLLAFTCVRVGNVLFPVFSTVQLTDRIALISGTLVPGLALAVWSFKHRSLFQSFSTSKAVACSGLISLNAFVFLSLMTWVIRLY